MRSEVRIVDHKGDEIKVGTKVAYGVNENDSYIATVTKISDPDGDYDDELERSVEIPPFVTIEFDDGDKDIVTTTNITRVSWADYPDGPAVSTYEASDEIEVTKENT